MKKVSRLAVGIVAVGIGAAVLGISPANAQQTEPLLHEQLIDGVRGLFGKDFRWRQCRPASAARARLAAACRAAGPAARRCAAKAC